MRTFLRQPGLWLAALLLPACAAGCPQLPLRCPDGTRLDRASSSVEGTLEQCVGADGVPHGPSRRIDPQGRLELEGTFDHGLREGIWRSYYPGLHESARDTYVKGLREGPARSWYPTGRPESEGQYRAGEKRGPWRYWDGLGGERPPVEYP